jgi:hypothetical protein
VYRIRPENWDAALKGVAEGIADYEPISMTTDDAVTIVRAHRTSRLASCLLDASTGKIKARLDGEADVATSFELFGEKDGQIVSRRVEVPAFKGEVTVETE